MRKGLAASLLVAAVVLAACGAERPTVEDAEGPHPGTETTPSTVADVPAEAAGFLEKAAGGDGAFAATYHVLRKLGPVETDVQVAQSPPWSKVAAGDVVVISGPDDYTCRISAAKCVDELREQQLTPFGVFSAFYSTGPIQAVETMARVDGATFERSSRKAAGLDLDCLAVLVGGSRSGEWCLTPDGFFGYVDTADVRVELEDYQPGATPDFEPPGVVVDDDGFLTAPAPAAAPATEDPARADEAQGEATTTYTAVESAEDRCDVHRCGGGG